MNSNYDSISVHPYSVTVSADLLTPVTAFLRLSKEEKYSFLFESVAGGEQVSRFSFIGVNPIESLCIRNGILEVQEIQTKNKKTRQILGNPFYEMGRYLNRYQSKCIANLPPFSGGAVGFIGYESVHFLEEIFNTNSAKTNQKKLLSRDQNLASPYDAFLMIFRNVVAFDHVRKELILISNLFRTSKQGERGLQREIQKAQLELEKIKSKLNKPHPMEIQLDFSKSQRDLPIHQLKSTFGKQRFIQAAKKIKGHIRAGDLFQCVLSEQFSTNLNIHPFLLYRTLRSISPAPYLFYLKMNQETLLGASPEMLVRVKDEKVESCPIAGTRPRGKTISLDRKFEKQLKESPKERAEHLMLVDLARNDVGRISKISTVKVPEFMQVEKFSHVMHLVSKVEGDLLHNKRAWDALAACFPAGTLTGAPKVRAMQIISQLEPTQRGSYGGAIIYHDFSGKLDSCIAIRSIHCRNGKAFLQAGAGIVADSSPEREYEEIIRKTHSVRQAFAMARSQSKTIISRHRSKS